MRLDPIQKREFPRQNRYSPFSSEFLFIVSFFQEPVNLFIKADEVFWTKAGGCGTLKAIIGEEGMKWKY